MVRVAEVASGPYEHGHARANGKVLLAFADAKMREAYLLANPLPSSPAPRSATARRWSRSSRASASAAGPANRRSTRRASRASPRRCCRDGHVVAALGLSVPTERFEQRLTALRGTLLEVAATYPPRKPG